MRDAVSIPVTVKHRIPIGSGYDYLHATSAAATTVATRSDCGCSWYMRATPFPAGLSPKENREIPPSVSLCASTGQEFAELEIVINGGFARWSDIEVQLAVSTRDVGPRGLSQPVDPGGGRLAVPLRR